MNISWFHRRMCLESVPVYLFFFFVVDTCHVTPGFATFFLLSDHENVLSFTDRFAQKVSQLTFFFFFTDVHVTLTPFFF